MNYVTILMRKLKCSVLYIEGAEFHSSCYKTEKDLRGVMKPALIGLAIDRPSER